MLLTRSTTRDRPPKLPGRGRSRKPYLFEGRLYTTFIMADRSGGMVTTDIKARLVRPGGRHTFNLRSGVPLFSRREGTPDTIT